ncbi:four helix bundle protein [Kovacikia minuta CCNUW1]|uniref:four helix bundle protein n=1 Tax=Kovacikia minuta TaxID=2931930 RepID=UPI001CCCF6A8|nr:four helix bundle protein [Kovacikia minuta CCNUW1]
MSVESYRDLKVWGKAMDLVVESYKLANQLPKTETYGLTNQIQRAAVSIPANSFRPTTYHLPPTTY